jgi:hypothetical protein
MFTYITYSNWLRQKNWNHIRFVKNKINGMLFNLRDVTYWLHDRSTMNIFPWALDTPKIFSDLWKAPHTNLSDFLKPMTEWWIWISNLAFEKGMRQKFNGKKMPGFKFLNKVIYRNYFTYPSGRRGFRQKLYFLIPWDLSLHFKLRAIAIHG